MTAEKLTTVQSAKAFLDLLKSMRGLIKHYELTFEYFQPIDVLKRGKDSLTAEKLATVQSAKAFLDLLKSMRGLGKDKIAEVMTSPESYYIV